MKTYVINIKEPQQPSIAAFVKAKSRQDLLLCVAILLKIRKRKTEIRIFGQLKEVQKFGNDNTELS